MLGFDAMNVFSYELDLLPESKWHFFNATAEAKANFVYLQELGHFYAGKNYYTTRQGLDSFLIKVTISGAGILEYGGQIKRVGSGQFYWIDCKNFQHYYTDPEEKSWNVVWAHFNGATAVAYYDAFQKLMSDGNVGNLPANSPIYGIFEMYLKKFPQPESQNLFETDIHNSSILTRIMTECIASAGSILNSVVVPPVVQEVRCFLDGNFDKTITLAELADNFSIDRYYLQKLYKKYVGQSPSQYIIRLRMSRAKNLLRTSSLSISEIAYAVGIDNLSHFSRQFGKFEGISPLQYRKAWTSI